jgi:mRNA-degrading endonuclease RelE of RelBE toxin-antitoxin system
VARAINHATAQPGGIQFQCPGVYDAQAPGTVARGGYPQWGSAGFAVREMICGRFRREARLRCLMYQIEFDPAARQEVKSLRKFDRRRVLGNIETRLQYEPTVESRNRKRLQPNDVADWELRVGQFRVFYNVDEIELIVRIEAIGIKVGGQLFINGESREL